MHKYGCTANQMINLKNALLEVVPRTQQKRLQVINLLKHLCIHYEINIILVKSTKQHYRTSN